MADPACRTTAAHMGYTVPMRIVSAVPILKGVAPDLLSYYTGLPVKEGSIVEVPIRKRYAPALVVEVADVKESSASIRAAAYKLKKVRRVISPSSLPEPVITTAALLSRYYATPLGTVLYSLVPQQLLAAASFLDIVRALPPRQIDATFPMRPRVLQMPHDERLTHYRSMIRESFAQKKSIVVVAPTRAEAEDLFDKLSRGIEDHAFLLVATLTPKQQRERWEAAMRHTDPVLIVGTLAATSVWRSDISRYILDHESSPYYKGAERPFIDARVVLINLAKAMRIDLVMGDSFPRVETIAKLISHEYDEVLRPQMHQPTNAAVTQIDMREVSHVRGESPVLSPQAHDAVERSLNESERTFIYATRKGHSPLTLCRDCGSVLACDRCDAPMVLHAKNGSGHESRWYACHRCGRIRDAETVCDVCGGWRLYAYGYGIEKIGDALKGYAKTARVFVLSADTVHTHAAAMKMAEAWRDSRNGILVGTARALPYLRFAPPATSIVAAFDTLLMLPDIYMQERLFGLLAYMREISSKRLLVQTRNPEHETLRLAIAGDGEAFFRAESERRRMFSYPPHGTPIKMTLQGKQKEVIEHLEALKPLFAPYALSIYPAFISKIRGHFIAHALAIIPTDEWPNERIVGVLRALPPAYRIDINPDSLL